MLVNLLLVHRAGQISPASREANYQNLVRETTIIPKGDTNMKIRMMNALQWSVVLLSALTLIAALVLTGCSPTPEVAADYDEAQPLVDLAVTDLAGRLAIEPTKITVQEVTATEFPNASLGVPEPGQMYVEMITPGYIIVLTAQGEIYEYHGAENRVVLVPKESTPTPTIAVSLTPEQVVEQFYTWYVGYIGERGSDQMRNPLVDKAYHSSPHLTARLIQEIDEIIASFDKGGYDPFLCAQDIPTTITVETMDVTDNLARVAVHTDFPGHLLHLDLVRDQGIWKINRINRAGSPALGDDAGGAVNKADWQIFHDAEYGVQMQYPADWITHEVELRFPEIDAPTVRVVQFLPQGWAEQMNLDGPPDPTAPPVVAPLGLEISTGTLEEYRQKYGQPAISESVELNDYGYAVTREQDVLSDNHLIRYVIPHPTNAQLQVTLVNQFTGFPERAADNAEISTALQQIIQTIAFTK